MRAYFCVLEVAVSANRCSIIQGCRICNYMEEDGNSSYQPTPLNASIVDVASQSQATLHMCSESKRVNVHIRKETFGNCVDRIAQGLYIRHCTDHCKPLWLLHHLQFLKRVCYRLLSRWVALCSHTSIS